MQKVLSARIDEAVLAELDRVTRRLGLTKRQFLEEAIHLRAAQADTAESSDVWAETLGAWSRAEEPAATVAEARATFRGSLGRNRRERDANLHR